MYTYVYIHMYRNAEIYIHNDMYIENMEDIHHRKFKICDLFLP